MRLNLSILCSTILLLAGASHVNARQPGGLTRATAAALIVKDPRFATASVLSLASPGQSVKAGVAEGLWVEENFGRLVLADAGRQYFSQAVAFPRFSVVLVEPARREIINVTSIVTVPTGA